MKADLCSIVSICLYSVIIRCLQKRKVDSRDLAENNQFVCEICDRGFKTDEKYNTHISEHEKVKYPLDATHISRAGASYYILLIYLLGQERYGHSQSRYGRYGNHAAMYLFDCNPDVYDNFVSASLNFILSS